MMYYKLVRLGGIEPNTDTAMAYRPDLPLQDGCSNTELQTHEVPPQGIEP